VKNNLKIVPVSNIDQVLKVALVRQPEPIDWTDPEILPAALPKDDGDAVVTH
jgi:ATP-dependent Lon protease